MIGPGLRFGRYEVGDRIGRGGFGVVHFARDVELGRELAIKFLRPEYQTRPMVVQRFLQEARAAARIGHPGIVTVFECGQIAGTGLRDDGTAFIAMELLKGESLADRLMDRGRLPAALAISIGRQLAAALASAHEAGIIHRDLKPDNVFLIPDPAVRGGIRVKILDFGVAKLAEPTEADVHTHSQVMLGTPRYMSPEQARSAARVDHRSDIYALGCILYELLCGRPPYSGDAGDLITKHQSAPVPSARSVVESTPRELDRLISAMLAKAPEHRPGTMSEVDRTLGDCETRAAAPPPRTVTPDDDPADEPTIAVPLAERIEESTLIQPPLPEPTLSDPTMARPLGRPPSGLPVRLALTITAGLVFGGLVTFLALRAAGDGDPAAPPAGDAALAEPSAADASAETEAEAEVEVEVGAAEDGADVVAQQDPGVGQTASRPSVPASPPGDLEIECLRYQTNERWAELDGCADRLKAFNPVLARELENRAVQEVRSAPRISGAEAALQDKNLKQAKAELEQVWTGSTSYERVRARYDAAEAAAIAELVVRLGRVNSGDCKEYNAILAQERASKPPRVAAEAQRQVRCSAAAPLPAACDPELLTDKARDLYTSGSLVPAIAAYDAAIACRPDSATIQKALVVACNLRNVPKAKSYWRRLPSSMRTQTLNICVRNNISEDDLDAP